ncbi:MAG: hypothetical protein M1816_002945 [Peltula sp. TS41687]|nr:MAG: hypothetical protein M1816_002945 [Peltula sp. TS41687]
MTISTNPADVPSEVDVIIAGAGTAACTLAGRLAAADPSLSIVLIEGGRNNHNDPTITNPAMYLSHLVPSSNTAAFYKGKPSQHVDGREVIVPTGNVLGGGSSINFMAYTRAQGVDFDSWAAEGWSQKDLIPLLRKTETYHIDDPAIDKNVHGYAGPVHVSRSTYRPEDREDEFLEVVKSLGYEVVPDLQDLKHSNGFNRWPKWISPEGKRQDAAHRFIHPLLEDGSHPNLHVLTETKVVRVLFDDHKRATGIEYVPNPQFQAQYPLSKSIPGTIRAKKLVVLSAGALGTPQILERSGVGNKELLSRLDIPVVAHIPGVGQNLQDHNLVANTYKTNFREDESLDALLSGRRDFAQALQDGDRILGWNGVDVGAKLRPTEAEVAQMGGDFQQLWDRDFKSSPERPLMLMGTAAALWGDPTLAPAGQYLTIASYTAYPYSRGSIHITSPTVDMMTNPPEFETGYFTHPADVPPLVWAYKKAREIARRLPAYRGELDLGHPKFPPGSKAALESVNDDAVNGVIDRSSIRDIEYSKEDDEAIEKYNRENVMTTWHSLGTCAMRAKEHEGVVDHQLNVHDVSGLKLCDLSIVPENVAANTNSTAFVVGEKGAEIIARELGLTNF